MTRQPDSARRQLSPYRPTRPIGAAGIRSASRGDALSRVDADFTALTGVEVKAAFAASAVLARQIEVTARAEVFFVFRAGRVDGPARATGQGNGSGALHAFLASEEASAVFKRSAFLLLAPNERPRCMHRGRTGDDQNLPCWKSSKACCSSSRVFITKGPYLATGSRSGRPATRMALATLPPAPAVTPSRRSSLPSPSTPSSWARSTLPSGGAPTWREPSKT